MKSGMDDKEMRIQGSLEYMKQPGSSHDEGGELDAEERELG